MLGAHLVHIMVALLAPDGVMGLSRWLLLPFAPFPRLQLYGLTSVGDLAETVKTVSWDAANGYFLVELKDCKAAREESLADLIDHYGSGWQLHEPGFEPAKEG